MRTIIPTFITPIYSQAKTHINLTLTHEERQDCGSTISKSAREVAMQETTILIGNASDPAFVSYHNEAIRAESDCYGLGTQFAVDSQSY